MAMFCDVFCDVFCERCAQAGRRIPAHYVLLAEKEELTGAVADELTRDGEFLQWHRLCTAHHAELPEDERMAYVPTVYAGPGL